MRKIIAYLEKIVEKSNNHLNEECFYLERPSFSKFNMINVFLIKQALDKQYNFWLKVINNGYLSKFYEPIIFALVSRYFKINYYGDGKIGPKKGDKYKNIKNKATYEVLKVDDSGIELRQISGGKNQGVKVIIFNLSDFSDKYKDRQIQSFSSKFAIVASKNEFEGSFKTLDKKKMPYKYITNSGTETKNVQLEGFMFFVVSNYDTIRNYIFDKNIKLEHIVFIGSKYSHQIQQDINRKYFKLAIFIGTQKPDADCLKWNWTLPEYQYFNGSSVSKIDTVVVENNTLSKLAEKFIADIKQLEKKYYIRLQRMPPYISYVDSLVVPSRTSRLKNRIDDLWYSFQKTAKSVLKEEFDNIDVDYKKYYDDLCANYQMILEQVHFKNNAKAKVLKQLEETNYLIAPERQTLEVWQAEIEKLNWQKVKIISFSNLKKIPELSTITVLSITNYDYYCELRHGNCNIKWLLYDWEYELYNKFTSKYDSELNQELSSRDRKKLTGIDYAQATKKDEQVNDLVSRIYNDEGAVEIEHTTTYQDHIDKKIIFTDGHEKELSANSTVILVNYNENIKYRVADLSVGDKIRVYENQHKRILHQVLSNSDNAKFNQILEHSKLWKKKLKDYCEDNKWSKTREIANMCNVAPATVEDWLKKSNTKFPQNIKPLKDILGSDYQAIYGSSKKYNSIMIALGRDLSDEISDYIITRQKVKLLGLLEQFDESIIEAISEQNMPIREIKEIINID